MGLMAGYRGIFSLEPVTDARSPVHRDDVAVARLPVRLIVYDRNNFMQLHGLHCPFGERPFPCMVEPSSAR